jgi:hypothetical protein
MLGDEAVEAALLAFTQEFPPLAVYKRDQSAQEYLADETEGVSNRQVALEEMLMLWLANENQACSPYLELFDDSQLQRRRLQPDPSLLHTFFDTSRLLVHWNKTWSICCAARQLPSPTRFSASLSTSACVGDTCSESIYTSFLAAWT